MLKVIIKERVIEGLLYYFKEVHPREGILLLRGKKKKDKIEIEEIIIPPFSEGGENFSTFNPYLLPIDLSILGTAHSHPNGVLEPSLEDLHNFYGLIMVIVAYPYEGIEDVALYNKEGKRVNFDVD